MTSSRSTMPPIFSCIPGVKETFGLVTLEAQACALPVVGIRGTAMDRIVCHDQSFWAALNTPDALASAVARAFEHDLARLWVPRHVNNVANRFAWPEVLARLFDLYRRSDPRLAQPMSTIRKVEIRRYRARRSECRARAVLRYGLSRKSDRSCVRGSRAFRRLPHRLLYGLRAGVRLCARGGR